MARRKCNGCRVTCVHTGVCVCVNALGARDLEGCGHGQVVKTWLGDAAVFFRKQLGNYGNLVTAATMVTMVTMVCPP